MWCEEHLQNFCVLERVHIIFSVVIFQRLPTVRGRSHVATTHTGEEAISLNSLAICSFSKRTPLHRTDWISHLFPAGKNVNSTSVCSHGRSWAIFLEALTSEQCQFLGFSCPGLRDFRQDFLHGDCFRSCDEDASTCGVMGQVGTARGALYLVTRPTGPYCGGWDASIIRKKTSLF
jgi:hypothetical protein